MLNEQNSKTTTVLLVEDDPLVLAVHQELFTLAGCTIAVATTGAEALRMTSENRYDFIVLDMGLPDIEGPDVAAEIRAREDGQLIPIIALTGFSRPEDKARFLEAGIDKVVIKPASFDTIQGILAFFEDSRHRAEVAA